MKPAEEALERPAFHWLPGLLAAAMAGAALAISGKPAGFVLVAAAAVAYGLFAAASIVEPRVLITVLLLVLELAPPLYFNAPGETPVYLSFFTLPIALIVVVMWFPDFHWQWDAFSAGLAAFLAATALSIPFAFLLSGTDTGMQSLLRWVLLSHAAPVYLLIRACRVGDSEIAGIRLLRLMLFASVLAASYGIVDFFWPIPLPHPAADQFIWLEGAVLRRAQGVFYESSNFGNFCGLFLVTSCVAFLSRREQYLGVGRLLLVVSIAVLSVAVLLAFSRSVWLSVLTALFVSFTIASLVPVRRALTVLALVLIPVCLLWMFFPGLWEYLVSGRVGRLLEILNDPNSATSGRFDTWVQIFGILQENPQYLLFGIGYKTANLTRLFHGGLVVDNGYLSLLLETGLVGFSAFLLWSAGILRTFYRLAQSFHRGVAFWATVLFSIWCGELVLLLAADALTYWRNIAIMSALAALTLNLAERSGESGKLA
jgi:hypothetical protein